MSGKPRIQQIESHPAWEQDALVQAFSARLSFEKTDGTAVLVEGRIDDRAPLLMQEPGRDKALPYGPP